MKFQLAAGLFPAPFGIDSLPRLSRRNLSPVDSFFSYIMNGTKLTYQLPRNVELELANEILNESPGTMYFRGSRYLSLLGGTRLVGSYASKADLSIRKYGASILIFGQQSSTTLEWGREVSIENTLDYRQIFRLGYLDEIGNKTLIGQLDYESKLLYLVRAGVLLSIAKEYGFEVMIQYQKSFSPTQKETFSCLLGLAYEISFSKTENFDTNTHGLFKL